jgi:peptidoglycan/LPS O-acetylase OafA/YrhL
MKNFLLNFQRITSNNQYIPQLDGLRFLAIFSVLLYHIRGAFLDFLGNNLPYTKDLADYKFMFFIHNGKHGVEIFFAISGFILALPFIQQYRYGGKKVLLKSFYLRRITRLEPPYIIVLLIFFLGLVISGRYNYQELYPNLLASFIYAHNIVFKDLPKVISVAWSLEVEVQFYLVAPFLMRIFSCSKVITRSIIVTSIITFALLQNLLPAEVNSLYKFFQYFAAGMLFADFYMDKGSFISKLDRKVFFIAGVFILLFLFRIDAQSSARSSSYVPWKLFITKTFYPFMIAGFFCVAAGNSWWKKILRIRLITVTGGMCYSIYLLHTAVISLLGKNIFAMCHTGKALLDFFVAAVILSVLVIITSSVFYKLIERPCMDKYWHKKLWLKFSGALQQKPK